MRAKGNVLPRRHGPGPGRPSHPNPTRFTPESPFVNSNPDRVLVFAFVIGIVLGVNFYERCVLLFEILAELGNTFAGEYTKRSPLGGAKTLRTIKSRQNHWRPV